jgi:hypothetical protein
MELPLSSPLLCNVDVAHDQHILSKICRYGQLPRVQTPQSQAHAPLRLDKAVYLNIDYPSHRHSHHLHQYPSTKPFGTYLDFPSSCNHLAFSHPSSLRSSLMTCTMSLVCRHRPSGVGSGMRIWRGLGGGVLGLVPVLGWFRGVDSGGKMWMTVGETRLRWPLWM